MRLQLVLIAVAALGCSKATNELYELTFSGEPQCAAGATSIGNMLQREIVVKVTRGKDFTKQLYTGLTRPSNRLLVALAEKVTAKFEFQLCEKRENAPCDVNNAVTYATRDIELDPARMNVHRGRPAKDLQTIEFPWPEQPLTCSDGAAASKATPKS
jgi:hypothetical protein